MTRQHQDTRSSSHQLPIGGTNTHTLRDASTLADLANGKRWVVAHQTHPSGSDGSAVWWWYIGRDDADACKAGHE